MIFFAGHPKHMYINGNLFQIFMKLIEPKCIEDFLILFNKLNTCFKFIFKLFMTPLEKLDKILSFFKDRSDLSIDFSKEYIWNLYIKKTPELQINKQIYEEILQKLVEDGYLRETKKEDFQPTYHLTMKGYLFDGYINSQSEIQRLQKTAISLSRRAFWWTVVIALGTLVAAIYYLFEILNHWFYIYPKK